MFRINFLPVIFFVLAGLISLSYARSGVEIHYTPTQMYKSYDQRFPVEMTITNFSGVPVTEVQIWYRWAGESRYSMHPLENEGFSYFASLNVGDTDGQIMEYYFSIAYLDNRRETYPSDAASGRVFRTAVQVLRNYGDQILIISPEPEEQMFGTDLVITASFSSLMSMIDPEKTRLYLDTHDMTPYLQKYNEFITFAPPGSTTPGRHKIRVELFNAEGMLVASREWNFSSISPRGMEMAREGWDVSGRFFAESRNEELGSGGLSESYNQSGLQLRATYQDWDLGGRLYFNNQEKSDRQPVNRYSGYARFNFWDNRYMSLEAGDAYPKMNPMILQNVFLRGVYARLFLKSFNIDFTQGKTNRGVEGSMIQIDSVTTATLPGVYSRKIVAIRPSFGSGDPFQLGFTYLKGKDDEGSIKYGLNPAENAALGSDLFLGLDQKRIVFEGNINASMYNPNIAGGSIPFDSLALVFDNISEGDKDLYDNLNKLITVNQYLILQPALAYQARLMLRYFKNNFSFIYESVDDNFYSLGQPYLLRDNRGFHIVDNISLVKNQVFLTLGFRQYRNNLQDIKSHTTTNQMIYASVSYFPMQNLPEFTLGYNNYSRNNDVPEDSIGSILNRPEDNQTTSINVSTGYRFGLKSLSNRVGLDLTSYRRDDIFSYAESNTDYLTLNLRTQYRMPLQTLLEFILQNTETGPDDPALNSKLDLTTFGFGANYTFTNVFAEDKLFLQANFRLGTVTSRSSLASVMELKYNRNYLSFRLNYGLPRYGTLGFVTDFLSYSGDREYSDFIYTLRYDINF